MISTAEEAATEDEGGEWWRSEGGMCTAWLSMSSTGRSEGNAFWSMCVFCLCSFSFNLFDFLFKKKVTRGTILLAMSCDNDIAHHYVTEVESVVFEKKFVSNYISLYNINATLMLLFLL